MLLLVNELQHITGILLLDISDIIVRKTSF